MGCSVGFKYAKNALAAGLHWGSSRRSPDLLVGWGGHTLTNAPPPRRLHPHAPPVEGVMLLSSDNAGDTGDAGNCQQQWSERVR